MYVINPSFFYFIIYCYNMFQNKFENKIFENGGNIIFGKTMLKKTCSAEPNAARTGLI